MYRSLLHVGVLLCVGIVAAGRLPTVAIAQSNVCPQQKYAWAENIGWTNWRDAYDGNDGVRVYPAFLSGFIWGENVGWINVGDGSPADGTQYANMTGDDFGVNVDVSGELLGLAWGENIGWINFSGGALADPPQPARIDMDGRLYGYVWGENVGWINLDDNVHFVQTLEGDLNADGAADQSDLGVLLAAWGVDDGGDLDGDGDTDQADLGILLAQWGTSCP